VPIIGTVLIGSVDGSLKDGISLPLGYGSILSGTVAIKPDGGNVILGYEFTAFNKKYNGSVKVFTI